MVPQRSKRPLIIQTVVVIASGMEKHVSGSPSSNIIRGKSFKQIKELIDGDDFLAKKSLTRFEQII